MPYRLALDIGANSIGWCLLDLDAAGAPSGIRDMGVRVFPDGREPATGKYASLAATRRKARSARRRRDRYLQRRTALLNALTRHGLMPAEPIARAEIARRDPYALRLEGLHRPLTPHELGRAIFHLNQRRGFLSNRRAERTNKDKTGVIEAGIQALSSRLGGAPGMTLGALLAERHRQGLPVRFRPGGTATKVTYDAYPARQMILDEFDAIWSAQSGWNPALVPEAGAELRSILAFQRRLKPVLRGRCFLETSRRRALRIAPSSARFRIFSELAQLRLMLPEGERHLTAEERQDFATDLMAGEHLKFAVMRKRLGCKRSVRFNLENSKRSELNPCLAARILAGRKSGKSHEGPLRPIWSSLPLATQDAIVVALEMTDCEALAVRWLTRLGLAEAQARAAFARWNPPEMGTASLSRRAMLRMLPFLQQGMLYNDAALAAGYPSHSEWRTGEARDRLPYYGELLHERIGTARFEGDRERDPEGYWGRVSNPTVHIVLNQLRRLVNAILEREGPPDSIVVEMLREVAAGAEKRFDIMARQKENQERNRLIDARLAELNVRISRDNRDRYRLWEELGADPKDRCCPYTGQRIGCASLFADPPVFEVEHILPRSMTNDDGLANLTIAAVQANRDKMGRTPWEAFHGNPAYDWAWIESNLANLPEGKRWRFRRTARAEWEARQLQDGFLPRHFTDTAYATRLACLYLEVLAPANPAPRIWPVSGAITGMLRAGLGLNAVLRRQREALQQGKAMPLAGAPGPLKDRTNHRHHAIDAVVVGLVDRRLVQKLTRAAQDAEARGERTRALAGEGKDWPWPGFVAEVERKAAAIVVSHRHDVWPTGRLLEETAFGRARDPRGKTIEGMFVVRRDVGEIAAKWGPPDARKKGQAEVVDAKLGERVDQVLANTEDVAERVRELLAFGTPGKPVRRVRSRQPASTFHRIEHGPDMRGRQHEKFYESAANHAFQLWRLPQGVALEGQLRSPQGAWPRIVQLIEAAKEDSARRAAKERGQHWQRWRPHPAAELVLELCKSDMVAVGEGALRRIMVVRSIWDSTIVEMVDAHESGSSAPRKKAGFPLNIYRRSAATILSDGLRKVVVAPHGRVLDPGPLQW